jgi:hypothetical protein
VLLVVAVNGFFLVIEVVFVAANMTKLVEGGWLRMQRRLAREQTSPGRNQRLMKSDHRKY